MKKTAFTIVFMFVAAMVAAQSSSSAMERLSMGISFNKMYSSTFLSNTILLRGNPSLALDVNASMRLGKRIGVGGYLSLMGTSPFIYAYSGDYGTDPKTTLYTFGWDDGYTLGGGLFVELHRVPYNKRREPGQWLDFVLHGGYGWNGQIDGLWGGFGYEYRITRQMLFSLYIDFGELPFAEVNDITDNQSYYRTSFGLKFYLK